MDKNSAKELVKSLYNKLIEDQTSEIDITDLPRATNFLLDDIDNNRRIIKKEKNFTGDYTYPNWIRYMYYYIFGTDIDQQIKDDLKKILNDQGFNQRYYNKEYEKAIRVFIRKNKELKRDNILELLVEFGISPDDAEYLARGIKWQ